MLYSARLNPSRTCIAAVLPSRRIRRCSPRPLPRASPSGLRCEVIRKLRPLRTRSATSFAAFSGFVILFLDVAQQLLDAPGARVGLVVAKLEVRRDTQANSLPEKMPDPSLLLVEILRDLLRLFLVQAGDEDAREMQIRTDLGARDGDHREPLILQIEAENLHQRAAERLSYFRCASGLAHCPASITTQVGGSILFFFLMAFTPLALSTSGHQSWTVRKLPYVTISRVSAGGAGTRALSRS